MTLTEMLSKVDTSTFRRAIDPGIASFCQYRDDGAWQSRANDLRESVIRSVLPWINELPSRSELSQRNLIGCGTLIGCGPVAAVNREWLMSRLSEMCRKSDKNLKVCVIAILSMLKTCAPNKVKHDVWSALNDYQKSA